MRPTIRLGRIGGIEVGVHYSWFAILALVTWSLAADFLPQRYPGWAPFTYWATGIFGALLLFASLLAHELAHSLVAKARGFQVEGITLFLLGGVSNLKSEAGRARDEFIIAAVGPATSFALSGVFLLVQAPLGNSNTPLVAIVWYLAMINLLFGIFNLLPAYPLDGGRVLRSTVWGVTGSLSKATSVAAFGGKIFGILLMAIGAFQVYYGNLMGGIWLVFIGWFLHSSASTAQRDVTLRAGVDGVVVRDVFDTNPSTITLNATLHDAVFDHFLRWGAHSLLVRDGDTLLGIITLADIRSVPRERWVRVRVIDAMTAVPLWQVSPGDDLLQAMDLLDEHSIHQAPVVEGDRLLGLLSRDHLIGYLHSRRTLHLR